MRSSLPETRAAAARAAHVAYAKALVPTLQEALAAESNAEAAREQMRGLASLGGPTLDTTLREAAKRFGGRLDGALLEAFARTRGPAAIPVIVSEEWASSVSPALRGELLLFAARGDHGTLAGPVQLLLDRNDVAIWRALVQTSSSARKALAASVAVLGLRSPHDEIAGITAWEMAQRNAAKGSAAAELFPAQPRAPDGAGPDTVFAFELLARSMGAKPQSQPAWIASLETREKTIADGLRPGAPIFGLMEPAERAAVGKRFARRFPKGDHPPSNWEAWPSPRSADVPETAGLRLLSNLPRGVVRDVLAVSGCKPKKDGSFGAAEVYYNVEGRPGRVRRIDADVSRACDAASTALFLMTLAPRYYLPVGRQRIVVAFANPECIGELDEPDVPKSPETGREETARVEGDVQPPRLVGKVEPVYPMKSRYEGREGVVILEAIISRAGCVREVATIQGVDPVLDYSAARAVSQWRYQPATLDGKPVDVYLTVTVTYQLR